MKGQKEQSFSITQFCCLLFGYQLKKNCQWSKIGAYKSFSFSSFLFGQFGQKAGKPLPLFRGDARKEILKKVPCRDFCVSLWRYFFCLLFFRRSCLWSSHHSGFLHPDRLIYVKLPYSHCWHWGENLFLPAVPVSFPTTAVKPDNIIHRNEVF